MTTPREISSSSHIGAVNVGSEFDGRPSPERLVSAVIVKITIWHAEWVTCLKVDYNNHSGAELGCDKSGEMSEVVLASDEYITTLYGSVCDDTLSLFKLVTSKGHSHGPFGTYNSNANFMWDAVKSGGVWCRADHTMGLLYFSGTWDERYIWSLQAHFAKRLGTRQLSSVVKYEKRAPASLEALVDAVVLSQFSRILMSPTVTLLVGPSQTEFHVSEGLLVQLPFFHAALRGQFREASDKRVVMPEDNPSAVAALIEFLYNGRYTYSYVPGGPECESGRGVPKIDRVEGEYHLGIFAVALKYNCEDLQKAAIVELINVVNSLEGIEYVRLWKVIYCSGFELDRMEGIMGLRSKMAFILRRIYAQHNEEISSIVKEVPELGDDFLRLLIEN